MSYIVSKHLAAEIPDLSQEEYYNLGDMFYGRRRTPGWTSNDKMWGDRKRNMNVGIEWSAVASLEERSARERGDDFMSRHFYFCSDSPQEFLQSRIRRYNSLPSVECEIPSFCKMSLRDFEFAWGKFLTPLYPSECMREGIISHEYRVIQGIKVIMSHPYLKATGSRD